MKKTTKDLLFERMHIIGNMPIKEMVNEDEFAEKAGQGKGMVLTLVENIESAVEYLNTLLQTNPELKTDIDNIIKRLTLGLDRAKLFSEDVDHKKRFGFGGLWGFDNNNTDGDSGGFGDGGGGE